MSCTNNRIRILPLDTFGFHRETGWLDKVIQVTANRTAHFWILAQSRTGAVSLVFGEQEAKLLPKRSGGRRAGCVYLGSSDLIQRARSFVEIRVRGIAPDIVTPDDVLIIAFDNNLLSGDLRGLTTRAQVEEKLWGIPRAQVGTTTISPATIEVGQAIDFRFSFTPGRRLNKGAIISFVFNKTFCIAGKYRFDFGQGRSKMKKLEELHPHGKSELRFVLTHPLKAGERVAGRYRSPGGIAFPCLLEEPEYTRWYSMLPVYIVQVSVDGGRNFVSPLKERTHTARFIPGKPERMDIFLPGRRRSGNGLEARGVLTDRFRNPSPYAGPIRHHIRLVLKRGPRIIRRLGPLAQYMIDAERFRVPLPRLFQGLYRIEALRSPGRRIAGRSNPMQIVGNRGGGELYWAGLHAHSEMSDGMETITEVYRRAREDAALDVAAIADHTALFSANQWRQIQDLTERWNKPPAFVTLFANEWNESYPPDDPVNIHINLYGIRKTLPRLTDAVPAPQGLKQLRRTKNDIVLQIHHHWDTVLDVWQFPHTRELIKLFEISSVHCNLDYPTYEAEYGAAGIFNQGVKIGLIGGGDSHTGHCALGARIPPGETTKLSAQAMNSWKTGPNGLAAILAPHLERRSVLRALQRMQVYATTGARILIDVEVVRHGMAETAAVRQVRVKAIIHGCEPIGELCVMRDSNIAHRSNPGTLDVKLDWQDPQVSDGAHYYYLRVTQTDGEIAWTTPVWVTVGKQTASVSRNRQKT